MAQSNYQRILSRHGALKLERTPWFNRCQQVSEFLSPFSGRFFLQDHNRDKSFNSIYDSSGSFAVDILSAGMQSGMTSPARPWFRLAVPDDDLMDYDPVKIWLATGTRIMRDIFSRSNIYRSLHQIYEELGLFSTAACILEEDFDNVIWGHPQTAGEYCIATDSKRRVNALYRECEMTVSQLVEAFGVNAVSPIVKSMWDTGRNVDSWRPVLHVIEPRAFTDRDPRKRDARNMPWASYWIELGGQSEHFLRESGYNDMPFFAPRWAVKGSDTWGHGPGVKALGDVKQLQHEQYRKAQAIDYMTIPPLNVPVSQKGQENTLLPGGSTYYDGTSNGVKAAFEPTLKLEHLLMDIKDVRDRINRAFYADLFLMISQMEGVQPRNQYEIAERHEEKLLMLGPVLERLHDEMLDPLIDVTFSKMIRADILPPPPQELQGVDLKIEFVSTLAQAQRAVGLGSLDRLIGTLSMIAPVKPEVLDKVDTDEFVDRYADMLAVDPRLIVANDKVAIVRDQRAAQQAQAAGMAAAPGLAKASKDLADAGATSKDAGLDSALRGLQGYSTPGVTE